MQFHLLGELRLDFPRAADVKESLECLTNFTGILILKFSFSFLFP